MKTKKLPLPSAEKMWTHLRVQDPKDLRRQGYTILAGPYTKAESELLRAVVVDADRSGRYLGYSETAEGQIHIWQRSKR